MALTATVVDYDSWNKGYLPPSEHVLIDQLSYRGARVIMGSDWGNIAVWVVMRGTHPSARVRKAVREMVYMALDDHDGPPEPYEYETPEC